MGSAVARRRSSVASWRSWSCWSRWRRHRRAGVDHRARAAAGRRARSGSPASRAPVTVARDVNGSPRSRAGTPPDLFFAQGYVHASERMWQMEVWRHISSGRLSELFGEGQLDTDRFIRTLGWRARRGARPGGRLARTARRPRRPTPTGVNAWLDTHRGSLGLAVRGDRRPNPSRGRRSTPWPGARSRPGTWAATSTRELFRYLADARLGDPARTDELSRPARAAPVITPSGAGRGGSGGDGRRRGARPTTTAAARRSPRPTRRGRPPRGATSRGGGAGLAIAGLDARRRAGSDHGIGSNDWVVGPGDVRDRRRAPRQRPAPGHLDAVDLVHQRPALRDRSRRRARTTWPASRSPACPASSSATTRGSRGAPRTSIPTSRTSSSRRPTRPTRPAISGPMAPPCPSVRTEKIAVKGGETVRLDVRETVHGPILNDVDERLAGAPMMALRWTGTCRGRAGPHLRRRARPRTAGDFDAFRAALSMYGARPRTSCTPTSTATSATSCPARPVRSDPPIAGSARCAGTTARASGSGPSRTTTCPASSTPSTGWIVTANNAAVDDDGPTSSGPSGTGHRAERIIDQVNEYGTGRPDLGGDGLRPDRYRAAPGARRRLPLLAQDLAGDEDGAPRRSRSGLGRRRARPTARAARPT